MIKLKLGQELKSRKDSSRICTVKICAEGGAMVEVEGWSSSWYTNQEIEDTFILPKEKFVPEENQKFYYFAGNGSIFSVFFTQKSSYNKESIEFGNCFQSERDCEQAIEKIKGMLNE